MKRTKDMVARMGRASYVNRELLVHPDPGAKALCVWLSAAVNVIADNEKLLWKDDLKSRLHITLEELCCSNGFEVQEFTTGCTDILNSWRSCFRSLLKKIIKLKMYSHGSATSVTTTTFENKMTAIQYHLQVQHHIHSIRINSRHPSILPSFRRLSVRPSVIETGVRVTASGTGIVLRILPGRRTTAQPVRVAEMVVRDSLKWCHNGW